MTTFANLQRKVEAKTVKHLLDWTTIKLERFPQASRHCDVFTRMRTLHNLSDDVQIVLFGSYVQQTFDLLFVEWLLPLKLYFQLLKRLKMTNRITSL